VLKGEGREYQEHEGRGQGQPMQPSQLMSDGQLSNMIVLIEHQW
jgi:hypothetical protein